MKRPIAILLVAVFAFATSLILRGDRMTESELYTLCLAQGVSQYHTGLAVTTAKFESGFNPDARGVFVEHQWAADGSHENRRHLFYAYGIFQIMGYNLSGFHLHSIGNGHWVIADQISAWLTWFSNNMPYSSELDYFTRYVGSGAEAEAAGIERYEYWEDTYKLSPVPAGYRDTLAQPVEASSNALAWILIPIALCALGYFIYKRWMTRSKS